MKRLWGEESVYLTSHSVTVTQFYQVHTRATRTGILNVYTLLFYHFRTKYLMCTHLNKTHFTAIGKDNSACFTLNPNVFWPGNHLHQTLSCSDAASVLSLSLVTIAHVQSNKPVQTEDAFFSFAPTKQLFMCPLWTFNLSPDHKDMGLCPWMPRNQKDDRSVFGPRLSPTQPDSDDKVYSNKLLLLLTKVLAFMLWSLLPAALSLKRDALLWSPAGP